MQRRARRSALVLVVGLVTSSVAAQAPRPPDLVTLLARAQLVDLTHTFDETTLVWPTSDAMRLETVAAGITAGGWYYASNIVHMTEHGGTHLDAPVHFAAGQTTADKVELSRLVGEAVVIDVSAESAKDADYLVSLDDVRRWEATQGRIGRGSRVLFRTGWSSRWPDAVRYLGTALKGSEGVAQLHFPGLHPDLATFLVNDRGVGLVGIDTASMDRGQSTSFETHRILASNGVPGLENLTNLEQLPPRGAVLFALPMKVGGGSGGPLRAIAVVAR
jgi:kynurenine formamidase